MVWIQIYEKSFVISYNVFCCRTWIQNFLGDSQNVLKCPKTRIVEEQKLFKNVVPHQPFTTREPGTTNVTIGAGTPDGAKKLLHFCRKNKITIGTYLMASFNFINSRVTVWNFTFFDFKLWLQKKLGNELRLDLDYNLRDRFPKKLGNTVVACYIGVGSISPKGRGWNHRRLILANQDFNQNQLISKKQLSMWRNESSPKLISSLKIKNLSW